MWLDRRLCAIGRLRTLWWTGSGPVPGRRKRKCWDWRSSEQTAGRSSGRRACLWGVGSCEVLRGRETAILSVDGTLTLERTWGTENPPGGKLPSSTKLPGSTRLHVIAATER